MFSKGTSLKSIPRRNFSSRCTQITGPSSKIMPKTYIFDTSILISDPNALTQFPEADIVLPVAVLEELAKLQKQLNEAGKNARSFVRLLDKISELGDISVGVMLENKAVVKVD